ncbi:hypothetical protein LguiB_030318 [Lonicera macranthoides]
MILSLALSPNVTLPPCLGVRLKKFLFSPVMCFEHPLSKNHFVFLAFALMQTYTKILSNFSFGTQNKLSPLGLVYIVVPLGI